MADPDLLEIAVGILRDADGRVLLAQRRPGTYGAGQWEFPGGKHEPGEQMQATLARELHEELGVTPRRAQHLIRMHNDLATQRVRLHIWLVSDWQGMPRGCEGQRLVWCPQDAVEQYDLLPGNRPIINALRLPSRLAITPDVDTCDDTGWWASLQATCASSIELLRLRAPSLDDTRYAQLAAQVIARAAQQGTHVLLERDAAMVTALGAAGLHWPAARAAECAQRPLGYGYYFGVSAHTHAELHAALRLDADFAVLSPVHATTSHPGRQPLGWAGWQQLRADLGLPVYALGGLAVHDVATAQAHNAQGVAAIRAFWREAPG